MFIKRLLREELVFLHVVPFGGMKAVDVQISRNKGDTVLCLWRGEGWGLGDDILAPSL